MFPVNSYPFQNIPCHLIPKSTSTHDQLVPKSSHIRYQLIFKSSRTMSDCDVSVAADNFSYTTVKKDFVKPVKPGMFTIQLLVIDYTRLYQRN